MHMLPNTGIKPQVQTEICQLAEKYHLNRVILFGSRARGDYWRASDIDLAVSGGDITRFSLDVEEETCYQSGRDGISGATGAHSEGRFGFV